MTNEKIEEYFLGLDIGTDSVGWAVTDSQYRILRRKGKSLWGIRLFDAANTAEERRMHRTGRRRIQRRRQRIQLLRELFAKEIARVDENFFQRMDDSAFWMEDKQEPQIYSLFHDADYSDKQYHKAYPTVYHLRKALICEPGPFDVRLVYLAIHHLMKNRGHFLFHGEIGNVTSFHTTFQDFCDCLADDLGIELECDSEEEFETILKEKSMAKTTKSAKLEELCHIEKTNLQLREIIKLIVGRSASLSVILDGDEKELEHDKICFSDSGYDEVRLSLDDELQEKAGIVDRMHALYSWVILADVLEGGEYEGKTFLSVAKVKSYEKHHQDLRELKALVRKYCPQEYHRFFVSESKDNYCAYVGFYKKNGKKKQVKRCGRDDFYKCLKKLLDKMPENDQSMYVFDS